MNTIYKMILTFYSFHQIKNILLGKVLRKNQNNYMLL